MEKKVLTTPIKPEDLENIKAGDIIYLTGHITTCRDVAHRRVVEYGRELPVNARTRHLHRWNLIVSNRRHTR